MDRIDALTMPFRSPTEVEPGPQSSSPGGDETDGGLGMDRQG
jgi:hypothetical protein